MVRLLHLVPAIGVGGTEGVLLDLCRYRTAGRFDCAVGSWYGPTSVIADEIRATGTPVLVGPDECRKAIEWADLVNVHLWGYSESFLKVAEHRPYLATLHWQSRMPRVGGLTICTSDYCRQVQSDPARFLAIPNGIDVERFRCPMRPIREEVVITRVCRPSKCAPYFWDVVQKLLHRHRNVRFRIVGNEEGARHPSPRVTFLGVRRDVPEILAQTDIFLYTPPPEVGTKDLVVMEASAAGVPCVVSDVSVVRESIEAGRTGFLVPFGDVEATVRAVSRLIEDRELRRRMSEQSVEMAGERFDVRRNVRRYELAFDAVMAAYRERGFASVA